MLKRFWIYRVKPEGIFGSDWHMLRYYLSSGKKSYIFVDYEIQPSLSWQDIESFVTAKLMALLRLNQSPFSITIDANQRRLKHRHVSNLSEIVEYHKKSSTFYQVTDAQLRDCVIRFYPEGHRVGVLFDHTLFDGILLSQEIGQPLLEYRAFSKGLLLQDKYWPIFSEVCQLYSLMRLAVSQYASEALPIRSKQSQSVVHHNWDFSKVKTIKAKHDCSFSDALLAFYVEYLFRHLESAHNTLRVGIVVGFKNPRFRNNYSVCRVRINRSSSVSDYLEQIKREVKKNQHEVLPLYQVFSVHDLQSRFKSGLIDCLFSPLFFFPKKGLSLHMRQTRFFNVPTGCPLYVFANAFGDRVYCSTTINTTAIDEASFVGDKGDLFSFNEDYSHMTTTEQAEDACISLP